MTETAARIIADTIENSGVSPAWPVRCSDGRGNHSWAVKTADPNLTWINDVREVGNAILQLKFNQSQRREP